MWCSFRNFSPRVLPAAAMMRMLCSLWQGTPPSSNIFVPPFRTSTAFCSRRRRTAALSPLFSCLSRMPPFMWQASICKSAPLRRHSDNQADVNAGAVQKNTCCRCTTAFLPCIKKESPIRASARKISCWMKKTAFTGADFLCWRCALRPERWSRSCLPDTAHRSNTSRKAGAAAGPTCTRSQR